MNDISLAAPAPAPIPLTEGIDQAVFGCDMVVFIASVEASITFKLAGPGMVVMSLLSDAQELLDAGAFDAAGRTIARAKHLIIHYRLGMKG